MEDDSIALDIITHRGHDTIVVLVGCGPIDFPVHALQTVAQMIAQLPEDSPTEPTG